MQKVLIFVDSREFASEVVEELSKYECRIEKKLLKVADYICSDRVAIEKKTSSDFVQSVIDQRLFTQVKDLKENFEKPLLIIEGEEVFERLNPNAVRGALASIALDFAVPIIWTKDPQETAGMIYWIARREQLNEKREIAVRGEKKAASLKQMQEFLIAGLPGVSNMRARALLRHFKTPEKIFSATDKDLAEVEGMGEKTAKKIRELLASEY